MARSGGVPGSRRGGAGDVADGVVHVLAGADFLHVQTGERSKAKPDLEWLFHEEPEGVNLERLRELYDRIVEGE